MEEYINSIDRDIDLAKQYLVSLQEEYRKRAEPIIAEIVRLENLKPKTVIVDINQWNELVNKL